MSLGLGLVSPGITVKEVDLTRGSTIQQNEFIAALAGPFAKGPVEDPVIIRTEDELINVFGKPVSTDNQSDYYYIAESFLSYGGVLSVIRASNSVLNTANVTVGSTVGLSTLNVKNFDDYIDNHQNSTSWEWAAKNPGTWANNLKICMIDDFADQNISGVNTSSLTVGMAVTCTLSGSRTQIGVGTTSAWNTSTILEGTLTSIGSSVISVKWNTFTNGTSGVSTFVQYKSGSNYELKTTDGNIFVGPAGTYDLGSSASKSIVDWYEQQTLGITNTTVYWKSIAPKPVSSSFATSRKSYNDSVHVVVVDDTGSVTGTPGNIVEKFSSLSKAKNAVISSKSIYYKEVIAQESAFVYAGYPQTGAISKSGISTASGSWGLEITEADLNFNVLGNKSFTLVSGANYDASNGFQISLSGLSDAYDKVSDETVEKIDFILGGPSLSSALESQALANKLISIAESRKDCIVTLSPFKDNVVGVTDSDTQTTNVVNYFNQIDSSSFAVFDSAYKFIFDRFTNGYKYIPCNGDVAGLMARTSEESHSWYSPAGSERGLLRNVIKLAYNPNQAQRDKLYINRVNPIINSPGGGVILFGDKTAQTFTSAFDRINVRRLFIEIERTISEVAKTFLFEFNDEFTRTSFLSQVEPYLRDIEAKRGITEFVVICDDTNNTPDVIDRNEFVAEVYVKPARSINFIGLTFVATRTGVAFEEVIGRF